MPKQQALLDCNQVTHESCATGRRWHHVHLDLQVKGGGGREVVGILDFAAARTWDLHALPPKAASVDMMMSRLL